MEFDSRHYLPPSLGYSDFYSPLALSHTKRSNLRGYPAGGPVGGVYGRLNMGRDDAPIEVGSARRRIAVACARCRKRKIRCSGDPGTGAGCTSCVMAGVDPTQCQFHRVGSDHLHKVIDGINMAHSLTNMASGNGVVPMYSGGGNVAYPRPLSAHHYPQDDTKMPDAPNWTIPYSEDASPVDNYQLDQSAMYLPDPAPITNPSMYGSPYRWAHPAQKQLSPGSASFMDQASTYSAQGLPYSQPTFRPNTSIDTRSPLSNMSSLHVNLPERPIIRQSHATGSGASQRMLPIPQPSSAQSSRVSFDLEHDQRLRSVQAIGTPPSDEKHSFVKPIFPWVTEGNVPLKGTEEEQKDALQADASTHIPNTLETGMNFVQTTTSASNDGLATSITPQAHLNFTTSNPFDPMSVTTPVSPYSNFRECRSSNSLLTKRDRQRSQTTFYNTSSNHSSKCASITGRVPSNGTLTSGIQYHPLPPNPSEDSLGEKSSVRERVPGRFDLVHHETVNSMKGSFQI